jgi:hypothetical protein
MNVIVLQQEANAQYMLRSKRWTVEIRIKEGKLYLDSKQINLCIMAVFILQHESSLKNETLFSK